MVYDNDKMCGGTNRILYRDCLPNEHGESAEIRLPLSVSHFSTLRPHQSTSNSIGAIGPIRDTHCKIGNQSLKVYRGLGYYKIDFRRMLRLDWTDKRSHYSRATKKNIFCGFPKTSGLYSYSVPLQMFCVECSKCLISNWNRIFSRVCLCYVHLKKTNTEYHTWMYCIYIFRDIIRFANKTENTITCL